MLSHLLLSCAAVTRGTNKGAPKGPGFMIRLPEVDSERFVLHVLLTVLVQASTGPACE